MTDEQTKKMSITDTRTDGQRPGWLRFLTDGNRLMQTPALPSCHSLPLPDPGNTSRRNLPTLTAPSTEEVQIDHATSTTEAPQDRSGPLQDNLKPSNRAYDHGHRISLLMPNPYQLNLGRQQALCTRLHQLWACKCLP